MKRKFAGLLLAWCLSPVLIAAIASEAKIAAAARDGERSAAIALIRSGSEDANAKLTDGTSALHWAVRSDDLEIVSLLILDKADVNAADPHGLTPLALACANANVEIARKLVAAGANPNLTDVAGVTPLMVAVRRPQPEIVRLLLDAGAQVDARDRGAQQTALMVAVRENDAAAVRLLLDRGADVNAATRIGKTPARRPPGAGGGSHGLGIVRSGWPERGYQDATPGGMTPLLYAARDGRTDIARMLIAAGAKVNTPDANKITPLLMAITNNQPDVADLLIKTAPRSMAPTFGAGRRCGPRSRCATSSTAAAGEHNVDRRADAATDPGAARSWRECKCPHGGGSAHPKIPPGTRRSLVGGLHRTDAVSARRALGRSRCHAAAA